MIENPDFSWSETTPEYISRTLDSFLAAKENMPHAYLFIGRQGEELAAVFTSKILSENFPNIDSIQFDAASGDGIEGIREVTQLAALMPVAGKYKVVVLSNMDQANSAMLNALLKNLEEPPSHAIFILLSNRPLLQTVMSRCQVLTLPKTSALSSESLTQAIALLEINRAAGLAERLSLVNKLADLKDDLLPQLLEVWLDKQSLELRTQPEKFKAVRVTMDSLQALRGNYNKKMILQNFVVNGLD